VDLPVQSKQSKLIKSIIGGLQEFRLATPYRPSCRWIENTTPVTIFSKVTAI